MNAKDLFAAPEKEYGSDYRNHFFQQYKLYLESAEKISDRRQNANNYLLTINTLLASFLAIASKDNGLLDSPIWRALVAGVGILICITWATLIKSYRQLNTGKFELIRTIESHLPVSLYKCEWKILGEGRDRKKYLPFSRVEAVIPWLFVVIYAAFPLVACLTG